MKKDITNHSKDFWKAIVAYGVADEKVLRNYDIITDHKRGLSYSQLAIKYKLSRDRVIDICK